MKCRRIIGEPVFSVLPVLPVLEHKGLWRRCAFFYW
jgi:hypothetical protein